MKRLYKQANENEDLAKYALELIHSDIENMIIEYFSEERCKNIFKDNIYLSGELIHWVELRLEGLGLGEDGNLQVLAEEYPFYIVEDNVTNFLWDVLTHDGYSHAFEDGNTPKAYDLDNICKIFSKFFMHDEIKTKEFLNKIKNILASNIKQCSEILNLNIVETKEHINMLINNKEILYKLIYDYVYSYLFSVDAKIDIFFPPVEFILEEARKLIKEKIVTPEMEQEFQKIKYMKNVMDKGIEMKEYEGKLKNRILKRIAKIYK